MSSNQNIYSGQHLDYFQRISSEFQNDFIGNEETTKTAQGLRKLLRIKKVGKFFKSNNQNKTERNKETFKLLTEDLITGLFGHKFPLIYSIYGDGESISIEIGTWGGTLSNKNSKEFFDLKPEILKGGINSLYPYTKIEETIKKDYSIFTNAGFATGIPGLKLPSPNDGTLQIDRIIRGMTGNKWACLILAMPLDEKVISIHKGTVIGEMRNILASARTERGPSPVSDYYYQLLEKYLVNLQEGHTNGMWRTAAYLFGDHISYYKLAGLWKGIFSDKDSIPSTIVVRSCKEANRFAFNWELPDTFAPAGPGIFKHLLQYQSLLNSKQLSVYMHFPDFETSGFSVIEVPRFDTVASFKRSQDNVRVGEIIQDLKETDASYNIPISKLTRHAFVAGVTGAGKTNSIFHLLIESFKQNAPFLVIEPAKTEYRNLLYQSELSNTLQIFTLGNENISPLRVNPFEILEGVKVSVHIDLLRSVFASSFGLWNPLPQILEQCIYEVYEDKGWDITSNKNLRIQNQEYKNKSFPTLTDLVIKAEDVIKNLGYDEKVTSNMRSALVTRINALRTGGKGKMLDVQSSFPMEKLLNAPTVLELEDLGDDDDKAFLMGLILIRLVEYRRAKAQKGDFNLSGDKLNHLLVIEEAHRLLANTHKKGGQEEAQSKEKAVETFGNLLSEIRAYGQGVIVADQIPTKLAPEIIKNTNLKLAHRIVSKDDREIISGAMIMDEHQSKALATLTPGQCIAFSEGDDNPLMIKVPLIKENQKLENGGFDEDVKTFMNEKGTTTKWIEVSFPYSDKIPFDVEESVKKKARKISGNPIFQREFIRLYNSVYSDKTALDRFWNGLMKRIDLEYREGLNLEKLRRLTLFYACNHFINRRGAQEFWTFEQTSKLSGQFFNLLAAKLDGSELTFLWQKFKQTIDILHKRVIDPYLNCSEICSNALICQYKHLVSDYINKNKDLKEDSWNRSINKDLAEPEESFIQNGLRHTWDLSLYEARHLTEDTIQSKEQLQRISACYAQQMLSGLNHELNDYYMSLIVKKLNES